MKKIILFIIVIILLIASLTFLYFYSVWDNEKDTEKVMISIAYKEVIQLNSIVDVDLFSSDRQFYFILGKTPIGNDLLVWLNDDEINVRYLDEWLTKDEMMEKVSIINTDKKVVRITLGINTDDTLMYEILVKNSEGKMEYQYYKLESGEFIKRFKLT